MDAATRIESMDTSHEPSYSRALVRFAKKVIEGGSDVAPVVEAASVLKDPYYSSQTLSRIARAMHGAGVRDYESVFRDACMFAGKVPREWRRAEILTAVAADMAHCDITDFSEATRVAAELTEEAPRKDAFKGLIKYMARTASPQGLMLVELASDERELQVIVNTMVNEYLKNGTTDPSELRDVLLGIRDPFSRGKALTYMGMKLCKMDIRGDPEYFAHAIHASSEVSDGPRRLELLKYVADKFIASDDFRVSGIIHAPDMLDDISHRASLTGYMAGKMSRYGREGYEDMFGEALEEAEGIQEPTLRYKTIKNIAKGMEKAKLRGYEEPLRRAAAEADGESGPWERLGRNTFLESGAPPSGGSVESRHNPAKTSGNNTGKRKRKVTLGLYNTYEKKLSPAHVRAVARAAPLCHAYGLELCLFGFPFKNEGEALQKVINETGVGRGGKYLARLFDEGRFHVRQDLREGVSGMLVATTSHPDAGKMVTAERLPGSGDACFLLGVGKSGLPASVLSHARYHLEFTGRNIPFETCTAMGILAYMIRDLQHTG